MGKPDLLTAVDAIYASVLDPERWPEALSHIAHLSGGLGAAIVPLTLSDRVGTIGSSNLDEATQDYNKEPLRTTTKNGGAMTFATSEDQHVELQMG
jgi:hypothetical protein